MDQTVETVEVLARRRAMRDVSGSEGGGVVQGTAQKLRGDIDDAGPDWRVEIEALLAGERLEEAEIEFDDRRGVCWLWFNFHDRPSFTPALLRDIAHIQNSLITAANLYDDRRTLPLKYVVLGSRTPGVWNLGGDLRLFVDLVRNRDRQALETYADRCTRELFVHWSAFDLPIITAAVVDGDALGGGFEAALSSNLIFAERTARFGLPEILFSLFPGMGAFSFLARRTSPGLAQRMMTSGRIYTGEELYEMGIVDVLAPDGQAMSVFEDFVDKNTRRHSALRAIIKSRQQFQPVTLEELREIAALWVDTILDTAPADLRKMERLAAAQDRRRKNAPQRR